MKKGTVLALALLVTLFAPLTAGAQDTSDDGAGGRAAATPAWTASTPALPLVPMADLQAAISALEVPVPQQGPEKHEPPEHTGFGALFRNLGSDFVAFPRRQSTWVILGIGAAAAALGHPADDYVESHIVGSDTVGKLFAPGKYVGAVYVQAGAAVGLYLVGRYAIPRKEGESRTNKVSHLGLDLTRAVLVSQALTQAVKMTVRRDRPTGECCAFPSGHAAATFATASVLERHLGYRAAWPTWLVAAYVSASRLHDNRHFLSDVLFGGALGVASGWTVVGRHGRSQYALIPSPTDGGMMVSLIHRPQ